jgi:hypothetical protein
MEELLKFAESGNVEEMIKYKNTLFETENFTESFERVYSKGLDFGHLPVLKLAKEWYSEWLKIDQKLMMEWDKDIALAEEKSQTDDRYKDILWFLKVWKFQTKVRNFFWDIWFITEEERKKRVRSRTPFSFETSNYETDINWNAFRAH